MAPDAPTLSEVEEALAHASAVPAEQRTEFWHKYVDKLLAKRLALAGTEEQHRETRLLSATEKR